MVKMANLKQNSGAHLTYMQTRDRLSSRRSVLSSGRVSFDAALAGEVTVHYIFDHQADANSKLSVRSRLTSRYYIKRPVEAGALQCY